MLQENLLTFEETGMPKHIAQLIRETDGELCDTVMSYCYNIQPIKLSN
jgi:hypothetical protein